MIVIANRKHIDWIVHHRVEMFRSMGWSEGELKLTETVAREFLSKDWDKANPVVFLYSHNEEIVGGCAVSISQVLPDNRNPSGRCAYLLSMFVEPEQRRKGIAKALLDHILEYCRRNRVGKVSLHDTEMSKKLYLSHGFAISENYYQKYLECQHES